MSRSSSQYAGALGALAVGAGLMLFAGSREWVRVTVSRPAPLPDVVKVATGGAVAPALSAAGLVLLAAIVAVIATKRIGRTAVGALALAAAVLGVVVVVPFLGGTPDSVAADVAVSGTSLARGAAGADWAPWLALAGAVVGGLGGALVALRGRTWQRLGDRYEVPTGDPAEANPAAPSADARAARDHAADAPTASDRDAWNALDDGVDPT